VTEHLDELSVYERSTDSFLHENPRISITKCTVLGVDYESHKVFVRGESRACCSCQQIPGYCDSTMFVAERGSASISALPYDKLCLCVGARPKRIADHPSIIGLRDQLSVEELLQRLRTASRVAVVGNGGIALELIHEVSTSEPPLSAALVLIIVI
jgi:hypothetical protein